ncbi:uncharacterized protein LOC130613241 [Hydractinia symbiolongicarpus]|uniref:uncharacterized protein LOC130613241 n=1 Tax=Hydractinia symbiolongicarpus TaxID=13093 RepID=UPI00254F7282|nr:uncharacterized protein LOC130613241 [Hydractinia symbiolongicarpus]
MMIKKLHSYLSSKNGTNLTDLERNFPQFENIKDVLESRPDLFWIATHNENHIEVRAKLNVKLCYSYLNSTCGGDCGCLHICKDNLLSRKYCQNPCKFGFSHNPKDVHNWPLLSKYKGSNWELLLRASFPRLCTSFSRSGQCKKLYCGYLHLCSDFVRDSCVGECKLANSCNQSKTNLHNCGNEHNKKVLKNFDLSYLKGDRNVLLANILMKNDGAFNVATGPDLKSFYPRSTTNNTSENPMFICASYLKGDCRNPSCPRLHMCKEFLINANKCSTEDCKFGFSHDLLEGSNKKIINRHSLDSLSDWRLLEHIRSLFPRICKNYQIGTTCTSEQCNRIHICPEYCSDSCSAHNCKFSHDLRDEHNNNVLQTYNLHNIKEKGKFTEKQLILANVLYSKSRSKTNRSSGTPSNEKLTLLMCKFYLDGNCKQKNCPRLHMCKEFLINGNKCVADNCKFGFSHDPLDSHNTFIMKKNGDDQLPSWVLLERVRKSFPRVCKDYLNGSCLGVACRRMHICPNYCNNMCVGADCTLSHKLKDGHNMPILQFYSLDRIKGGTEKFILANVLISSNEGIGSKSSNSKLSKNVGSAVLSNSNLSMRNDSTNSSNSNLSMKNDSTKSSTLNLSKRRNKSFTINDLDRNVYEEEFAKQNHEPSEEEIFQYILNNSQNGYCPMANLLELFNFDLKSVENWLEKYKYTFRIVSAPNKQKFVYLCLKEIRPCHYYWKKGIGCRTSQCKMFHICRALLIEKSHNKRICKFTHDFKDVHEKMLIDKFPWKYITEEQILLLLKIRYPYVCADYLKKNCQYGEDLCPNLHVCYDFMRGSCKKQESLCNFKHESGASGKQAKRLMQEYQLNEKEFRSCIILPKINAEENVVCNDSTVLKEHFNWLKEEGICSGYLVSECEAKSSCHLIHPSAKLPYLWQYKNGDNTEEWKNLPVDVNMELEKEFCDPSSLSYETGNVFVLFSSNYPWYGQYNTIDVFVRRLSTISSVKTITEEAGATEWKWYWHSGGDTWIEYDTYTTSDDVEKNYLSGSSSHQFETNEYKYKLAFHSMKQKNLDERYQTEREVRRRPVYKDKDLIRTKKASLNLTAKIPAHWPKKFKPGERITVDRSIYGSLKTSFKASIATNVQVLNIEEICHEDHHDRYERKKKELTKKMSSVNEKTLYHGTECTVVDAICAQNFDWRLCGKNATMYGQGSYFSTSAKYSHNYTTPDMADVRYMFVAEVLVGRCAKGNSTMKRPPLLPNSKVELYDSCVNDLSDPSIFVVFERDQCYPKYLISYKITSGPEHRRSYVSPSSSIHKTSSTYYHGSRTTSNPVFHSTNSTSGFNPLSSNNFSSTGSSLSYGQTSSINNSTNSTSSSNPFSSYNNRKTSSSVSYGETSSTNNSANNPYRNMYGSSSSASPGLGRSASNSSANQAAYIGYTYPSSASSSTYRNRSAESTTFQNPERDASGSSSERKCIIS